MHPLWFVDDPRMTRMREGIGTYNMSPPVFDFAELINVYT